MNHPQCLARLIETFLKPEEHLPDLEEPSMMPEGYKGPHASEPPGRAEPLAHLAPHAQGERASHLNISASLTLELAHLA